MISKEKNCQVQTQNFRICEVMQHSCLFYLFIYLFIRFYSTSAEGLQDTRSYSLLKMLSLGTVCLKSCRQKKKSMMHQNSLEPAANRFMLEHLQESARRSGQLYIFLGMSQLLPGGCQFFHFASKPALNCVAKWSMDHAY